MQIEITIEDTANVQIVISGQGAHEVGLIAVRNRQSPLANAETSSASVDTSSRKAVFETFASVDRWLRVARLARIAISEDEIADLCVELNSILAFLGSLNEVNVAGVEPMTSVTPMQMKKRADAVTDGDDAEAVLKNAPAAQDHYFMVPKVIE